MHRALVFASLITVAACGDETTEPPPDELLAAPPAGAGRQLAMDVTVAAGEETEQCQYVVLDDDLAITRFEHAYTRGSHHLLLYQTSLTAAQAPAGLFDCTGAQLTELGVAGIAYAAQVPDGELAYPSDVALRAAAGSVLLVQTHYLNASAEDLDAQVRLNLWTAATPPPIEAGTLFFYDWAIHVPAGETATAEMRCQVPADVELIFGMSHMHRRGVGYRAELDAGGDAAPVTLFETTDWEGIEPRQYEPRQRVTAGSTIAFHCEYQGEPGRPIIEGPSADANEMCMFIASYYPRVDAATELCAGPASGPVFSGTQTCGETVGCVTAAGADAVAAEACIVDTCAGSSQPAASLMTCIFYACDEPCAELGSSACTTCVLERCGAQFDACQSATCA